MTQTEERYIILLDWKNEYFENDYTTQSNLQIQCNPHQTTNGIFQRIRTKMLTIWNTKDHEAKVILRKKNGTVGIRLSNF